MDSKDKFSKWRLQSLVHERKGEILAGKWTQRSFATMAQNELCVEVTHGEVSGAADTFGFKFPKGKSQLISPSYSSTRYSLYLLCDAVTAFYAAQGTAPPPELDKQLTWLKDRLRPIDGAPIDDTETPSPGDDDGTEPDIGSLFDTNGEES
jgi:hypothetical protein